MITSLFRAVREDSRLWWHHVALRRSGNVLEARMKEHGSIKSLIGSIRQAVREGGFLMRGRGGDTLHLINCRVEGMHRANVEAVIMAGVLTVDTRSVPDSKIVHVAFRFPLGVPDGTPLDPGVRGWGKVSDTFAGTGALESCRISAMLDAYEAAGAIVVNRRRSLPVSP